MNKAFLKRRYYDMRLGGTQISPMIQMANFIGISFLWINHIIPIEVFGILFALGGLSVMTIIGAKFRKHQSSTDLDLLFERQRLQGKILYNIMKALQHKDHVYSPEFLECLEILQKIRSQKI